MRFIVFKFRNLLYTGSLLGCTLSDLISVYYCRITSYQKSFSRRDYISKILLCSTMFWVSAVKLSFASSTVVTHSSIREVIVYTW